MKSLLLAATALCCLALPAKAQNLSLYGYHLTYDWEADSFNPTLLRANAPPGSLTTTLGHGWRTFAQNSTGEQECYGDATFGVDPFVLLSNGTLRITAAPAINQACPGPAGNVPTTYASGIVTTQGVFSQTYGYFEMRAKMPAGAGMWPAFWLTAASGAEFPEIDAVEAFGATNPANGQGGTNQVHWDVHSAVGSHSAGGWAAVPADITAGFHSYGVLWRPDYITWYFDGVKIAAAATPPDANVPMFLIANISVGGSWAGAPAGEAAEMQIDYIRAFAPGVPMQPISSPDGGGKTLYGAQS